MNKKTIGLIAIIVGGLFAIISLTADFIGLGSYPGINSAQLLGAAIGLLVFLLGLRLRRSSKQNGERSTE